MSSTKKIEEYVDLNMKIIVVDDQEAVRSQVISLLGDIGFSRTDEAKDGHEALDKILEESSMDRSYDMIIADIHMPNMNGLELLKNINSVDEIKGTPFLIVSAENDLPVIMDAIELGASNYLVKPVTKDAIIGKLNRIFEPPAS